MRQRPLRDNQQFTYESNEKLRLTLLGMADKYSEFARTIIYMTYNDPEIARIYRSYRLSGVYNEGGRKNQARRRKIIEFPNTYVYEFCNTILTAMYDKDWLKNNKALSHEIIKPWLVVERI